MNIALLNFKVEKWEYLKENIKGIVFSKVVDKSYFDYRVFDSADDNKIDFKLLLTCITVLRDVVTNKIFLNYETKNEYIIEYHRQDKDMEDLDTEIQSAYKRHRQEFNNKSKGLFTHSLHDKLDSSEITKNVLHTLDS